MSRLTLCLRWVANDMLLEPAYVSPSGPIAAIDILYGHRPVLQAGNHYMAHRCGFTEKVLIASLQQAGFAQVASFTRPECFNLWALATCQEWKQERLMEMAQEFLPIPETAAKQAS